MNAYFYTREVPPLHSIKAYRGNGVINLSFFNFGTGRKRVALFTPQPLYLRIIPTHLNSMLDGLLDQSGSFGEEKTLLSVLGIETRTV
jgi:hypothetical protein